jgi:hypothetical protein
MDGDGQTTYPREYVLLHVLLFTGMFGGARSSEF